MAKKYLHDRITGHWLPATAPEKTQRTNWVSIGRSVLRNTDLGDSLVLPSAMIRSTWLLTLLISHRWRLLMFSYVQCLGAVETLSHIDLMEAHVDNAELQRLILNLPRLRRLAFEAGRGQPRREGCLRALRGRVKSGEGTDNSFWICWFLESCGRRRRLNGCICGHWWLYSLSASGPTMHVFSQGATMADFFTSEYFSLILYDMFSHLGYGLVSPEYLWSEQFAQSMVPPNIF